MKRLALILSFALIAGCGSAPGKVYPLDEATVAARVRATEVPMLMFTEVMASSHVVQQAESGNRVVWVLDRRGSELFRYVATITPERAESTSVAVSIEPGHDRTSAAIFKQLQANADIAKIYQVAMAEAVDASIRQRPYDPNPMYARMVTAMFNHKDKMFEGLQEQSARDQQRYRSNVEHAYKAQGKKY